MSLLGEWNKPEAEYECPSASNPHTTSIVGEDLRFFRVRVAFVRSSTTAGHRRLLV